MANVEFNLNNTLAGKMAKQLDAKDGNEDGKISKDIWNQFADSIGRSDKHVKEFITIEQAMNSITKYCVQAAAREGGITGTQKAKVWFERLTDLFTQTPPAANPPADPPADSPVDPAADPQIDLPTDLPEKVEPPAAVAPPEKLELSPNYNKQYMVFANSIAKRADGTNTRFDQNGYIDCEYDANGNTTRLIERDSEENVTKFWDFEYDANGNETRQIRRDSEGNVTKFLDYEYDANGNVTREIFRDSEGNVTEFSDYEYDANGNRTRVIERDSQGKEI